MNITLATVAANTHTPGNIIPSDGSVFADNYSKVFSALTEVQRKAIEVLALIEVLHTLSGSQDYRTNHVKLISDSAQFTRGISNFNLGAAMAAIEWSNSGNLSADVSALLTKGPHLTAQPIETLDRAVAMLRSLAGY
jgi:hypothetical protein